MLGLRGEEFLSIQAQDFIEEYKNRPAWTANCSFLSIQAQDFIEECGRGASGRWTADS